MIDLQKLSKQLKTIENEKNIPLNKLRIILAIERIIARLQMDKVLSKCLIYKGGFVNYALYEIPRFTRDIDALGHNIDKKIMINKVQKSLKLDINDGFWFGDITVKNLDAQGEYGGIRFDFRFHIGKIPEEQNKLNKLSRIHLDIGLGDAVAFSKESQKLCSVISDFYNDSISWYVYPPEYIFSEKLHALVKLGASSSRAKDIYDMFFLFSRISILEKLAEAIIKTFDKRKTSIPDSFNLFLGQLDTSILEISWSSVQIINDTSDFKDIWIKFLEQLNELDRLFIKKG